MTQKRTAGRTLTVAAIGSLAGLLVAAVSSLAIAASPAPSPGQVRANCTNASTPAADSTIKVMRKSVQCLINQSRAEHGFGRMSTDKSLQKAAQSHTKAMVSSGCLAHRCGDEPNLEARLRRAGYFDGEDSWRYAENTGCGLSVDAMVANWLGSVYHRVNILDPDFEDIGVGVSQHRVPGKCGKGYGTFTVVFGQRTP